MISENPEGFSGIRLDVWILSFVGRSGAETSRWQWSRSVISAPVARIRSAGACNYLIGEQYVLLLLYFYVGSIPKMSDYFYYFSSKNHTIIKIAYVLLV